MQRIFLAALPALVASIFAVGAAVLAVSTAQAANSALQKLPLGWSVSCEPLPSRKVDPIV